MSRLFCMSKKVKNEEKKLCLRNVDWVDAKVQLHSFEHQHFYLIVNRKILAWCVRMDECADANVVLQMRLSVLAYKIAL